MASHSLKEVVNALARAVSGGLPSKEPTGGFVLDSVSIVAPVDAENLGTTADPHFRIVSAAGYGHTLEIQVDSEGGVVLFNGLRLRDLT